MHKSVLLEESINGLNIKEDSIIIDCTLGYGGHSSEILKLIPKGHLYAFDQDINAIEHSREKLEQIGSNYTIIKSNFKNIKEELNKYGVDKVDGILFDLGVSSPQLDEKDRGFSFHKDAILDMRMDLDSKLSAYEVVNKYSYNDLVRIFRDYGEEKYASGIAKKIVAYRENEPIKTTLQLVDIIISGVPYKYSREKHPARKVFQAIRIEVNNELEVFKVALKDALSLIKVDGRICVITFHSLEDRICKNLFKEVTLVKQELKGLPVIPTKYQPKYKIVGNIEPSKNELEENNRSRSAKLRIIEKVME